MCVKAWNSAFLSSCKRGFRPPAELNLGPGALLGLTTRASELLRVVSGFLADIRIGCKEIRPDLEWMGNQWLLNSGKAPKFPSSVK